MNELRSLLTAFCAACVFIGALQLLCPEGKMEKSVKYILGLVFLVSVIGVSGFASKDTELSLDLPHIATESSEKLEIASAEYAYSYALKRSGVEFSKITVCTDKSQDGSINITKVIICSNCERDKILQALGQAAQNYEVEIVNE